MTDYLTDPTAPLPGHVRGLIFDCDGTLVDTMPLHYRAWKHTLDRHDIAFTEPRFYSFAGMPTQRIIEILAREQAKTVDAEQIAHEKEEAYMALMPTAPRIVPVTQLALRERGRLKLAVASGGWARVVRQTLEAIAMLDCFDAIVGADDVAHGKPSPDVFLKAAERMGLSPAECLVYEDGEQGFEAARRAGIPAIDVRPWYLPRK